MMITFTMMTTTTTTDGITVKEASPLLPISPNLQSIRNHTAGLPGSHTIQSQERAARAEREVKEARQQVREAKDRK